MPGAEEEKAMEEAKGFVQKFEAAMEDDFNTADAVSAIFELVKFANTNVTEQSSRAFVKALKEEIVMLSDICGLIVEVNSSSSAMIICACVPALT